MKKVIIIGGVAGGASCAARLRRNSEDIEIVLLEKGPFISFANCGLPYHISDVISQQDDLLLMTPELMQKRFKIDVRVNSEVTAIDRDKKTVTIKNNDTTYDESYDTLVIATGSSPLKPAIEGIDSSKIKTLWTVNDAIQIKGLVKENNIQNVAVIGGGFIGLEMADNLLEAGKHVTILEAANQVMAPLDIEMAEILHKHIRDKGIDLHLQDGVRKFEENNDKIITTLESGTTVESDLVILSIGVRPNSAIAKDAGLELNKRGGIVVDEYMKTSDDNIYAVGDVVEIEDFITHDKTMIPLAGPANKQGRLLANTIAGNPEAYHGTQGSSIAKVFDYTAASTGLNEKTLIQRGLEKEKDYKTVMIVQNHHAGYYPGAKPMVLKLLFNQDGSKIYGAQIVGTKGVDKRIDTLSVAIRLGATVEDLKYLETSYAPPYSSAKDPVNMLGFTADNKLKGYVDFATYDEIENNPDAIVLDVREDSEVQNYALDNIVHIPFGQLRDRLDKLDKDGQYIIMCGIGVRAYNSQRILNQNGFHHVKVYPGGMTYYLLTHKKKH